MAKFKESIEKKLAAPEEENLRYPGLGSAHPVPIAHLELCNGQLHRCMHAL